MKNKIYILTILALSCVAFTLPSFAIDYTAIQLNEYCQKNLDSNNNIELSIDDEFKAGFCVGFIKGLDDLLYLHYSMPKHKNTTIYLYCMPDNVTLNDMSETYVEYLKKHPELNDEAAGKVLIKALMDKYSCK